MKYLAKFLAAGKTKNSTNKETIKTIITHTKPPFDGFDGSSCWCESVISTSFDGFDGSLGEQDLEYQRVSSALSFIGSAEVSTHQYHQTPRIPHSGNLGNDLFADNCRRCGDFLQADGSCDLCKLPLPF